MRRIILFTILTLTATSGAALADRNHHDSYRGDHRGDYHGGGTSIRNPHDRVWTQRDHRVYRRPVYVNDGYYQFHNGYRYRYARPVIQHRYYDYRVRPQIIVENYETVPGYIWVQGHWQWNGYEWIWTSGYYSVDPSFADGGYYDDGIRY
jgi:hypothetical protein